MSKRRVVGIDKNNKAGLFINESRINRHDLKHLNDEFTDIWQSLELGVSILLGVQLLGLEQIHKWFGGSDY